MSETQCSWLPSIDALIPHEEGGSEARTGFAYQDHVAARYCIQMLRGPGLLEVWCEAEDDITLLRQTPTGPEVEFVQVKANDLSQLWSVALLCSGNDQSIAAKSLGHDRCAEPCTFRIVTRTGINDDLRLLSLALDHPDRALANDKCRALHREICTRLGDVRSPRYRSASHWVSSTRWEIGETEDALEARNNAELEVYLEGIGHPLFSDQRKDLYARLLRKVQQAACLKWVHGPEKKKICRASLVAWLLEQIEMVKGNSTGKAGEVMRGKMEAAILPSEAIAYADRLRIAQRSRDLDPKYMADTDAQNAELEVIASLNQLLSQLDSGSLQLDGPAFHARCLRAIATVKSSFPGVHLSFLQGVMYVTADRCRHRFLRARP